MYLEFGVAPEIQGLLVPLKCGVALGACFIPLNEPETPLGGCVAGADALPILAPGIGFAPVGGVVVATLAVDELVAPASLVLVKLGRFDILFPVWMLLQRRSWRMSWGRRC